MWYEHVKTIKKGLGRPKWTSELRNWTSICSSLAAHLSPTECNLGGNTVKMHTEEKLEKLVCIKKSWAKLKSKGNMHWKKNTGDLGNRSEMIEKST